jgi:ubiquinone/menaquinone biosynthesis C-methylase UbiE
MDASRGKADHQDLLLSIRQRIEERLQEARTSPMSHDGTTSRVAELSALREQCRAATESFGAIGNLPPGPRTLRGRAGKFAIRCIQRMLVWYTSQVVAFNGLMSRIATLQFNALSGLSDCLDNEVRSWEKVRSELAGLRDERERTVAQIWTELAGLRDERERTVAQIRTELAVQSQRLSVLLSEVRRSLEAPSPVQVENIASELSHGSDALYVQFEDVFRGTREDIKGRLRVYLPKLKAAGAGNPGMPILDVGCGRGEWLELLADEDLAASGVDANRAMVLQCCERCLKVVECDAIAYLRKVPDHSLGAVTAFHVLEHLPFDALLDVLGQTVRVLKPGGLAIFETPNPANLLVGSYSFYTDPTHHNPLPSQTLAFLAGSRGLCDIEVLPLHPPADELRISDDGSAAVRWLNEHFYGPQDYAVIGKRP